MVLAADAAHSDNNGALILAALLGIATVVMRFAAGLRSTVGSVRLLIAGGAMLTLVL